MRKRQTTLRGRLLWTLQGRWLRVLLHGHRKRNRDGGAGRDAAKVEIPGPWQARIAEDTRTGHRWLRDNFDLDLEGYGYPL